MNTSATASSLRGWKRFLVWVAILVAGSITVLAGAAIYTFTLDPDARALRRSLTQSIGARTESTIELRVSEPLVSAARLGIHWCHDIPQPVRVGLASVRSASVGVYHIIKPSAAQRSAALVQAESVMHRKGWTRIVGVNDHETTVLVYAPAVMRSSGVQEVCVGVIDGDKLIVVSARGDMSKLAELAPIHEALHRL